MTRDWAQWQGETVDGRFRLDRYLGGSEYSGVFATEFQGQKAAIKLREGEPRSEPGAELSHPHLLKILRTGRWEREGRRLSYVVMEYADEVLSNFIPERALEAEEARETLAPVLEALTYLHDRCGLVHGRIKPSNILSIGEKLKISSDGLRRVTEPGSLAARGAYDAPEAPEGRCTPAMDVWSVGVTVVEMLTRQVPVGDGRGNPVLPTTLEEPFRDIASHCLQPDPQRRWTVTQIADRLAGRPVERMPARPAAAAAMEPARAAGKPKPMGVVVGAVAVVLVAAAAFFLRSGSKAEAPAAQPTTAAREAPAPTAPAVPRADKNSTEPANRGGKVEHAVEPNVSRKSLATIQGHVKVRITVRVNSSGKVVETKLETPRVSRYFATAALRAARQWKFVPPKEGDTAVASSWVIEFDFGRGGAQTYSRQVS